MAANAMEFPGALRPSRPATFHPENPSRSGGISLTGSEQVTISPAGRWRATLELPVYSELTALAYRAFIAQLEGKAGTVLVPKWEVFGPRDMNGRRFSFRDTASDGLNFDLTGFGQSDQTHAVLAAGAALGATRISVALLDGEGPRPGQYFGLGQRLHLCQAVWQVSEGDPTTIQFWPRLRQAVPSGERVILDRPVCLMRLAEDMSGELDLDTQNQGRPTMEFVEVL